MPPAPMQRKDYSTILSTIKSSLHNAPVALVFSSSRNLAGGDAFQKDAKMLGHLLGRTNATYVYGSGNSGLMGDAAFAFRDSRKEIACNTSDIIGVTIPKFHSAEEIPPEVAEIVARDIDLRVRFMRDLATCVFVLPGGLGTFEESYMMLSKEAYTTPTNAPIIFVDTPFKNPRTGVKSRAHEGFRVTLQDSLDIGAVSSNHLDHTYFANTAQDAVAFALSGQVNGLYWHGNENERPQLGKQGIQTLEFNEI